MKRVPLYISAALAAALLGVAPATALADDTSVTSAQTTINGVTVNTIVDESQDLLNDSILTAEDLAPNTTIRGTMRNKIDQDWYKFSIIADGTLTIVVEEGNTSVLSNGWLVELWTKEAAENPSQSNISAPTTVFQSNDKRTTTYEFGGIAANTYYVRVTEQGNDITEGASYLISSTHTAGIIPNPEEHASTNATIEKLAMYRLYNKWTGEHFYTASAAERNDLRKRGWKTEGVGWYAPIIGDPVYRLYNPYTGDHHFSKSKKEVKRLLKLGWRSEGIGFYSAKKSNRERVPVYREYNPWTADFYHNYTTSLKENDHLVKVGWIPEGIGWYGVV